MHLHKWDEIESVLELEDRGCSHGSKCLGRESNTVIMIKQTGRLCLSKSEAATVETYVQFVLATVALINQTSKLGKVEVALDGTPGTRSVGLSLLDGDFPASWRNVRAISTSSARLCSSSSLLQELESDSAARWFKLPKRQFIQRRRAGPTPSIEGRGPVPSAQPPCKHL